MGAAWPHHWGESHGIDHHCPMAPSVFWGPGQPLGWASWVQPGSGVPGPKWGGGKQGAALPWGSSTDVLKSKEDLFRGTSLAGAMPL